MSLCDAAPGPKFLNQLGKSIRKSENTSMRPGHHITHITGTTLRVNIQGQVSSGRTVISVIVQKSYITTTTTGTTTTTTTIVV